MAESLLARTEVRICLLTLETRHGTIMEVEVSFLPTEEEWTTSDKMGSSF